MKHIIAARTLTLTFAAALAGCGASPDDATSAHDNARVDEQGRAWQRLGDAPVSHRSASDTPDADDLRRASRLRARIDRAGTVLDDGAGEFFAPHDAARAARAVADYDRVNAEGHATPREAVENLDPYGVRRDIQGGTDNRTRVSTGSLGNIPYRYIGRYEIPVSSTTISVCTGTLIGSRYVALAAHCVYDRHDDAWLYGYNSAAADYRGRFCINGVCANVVGRKMSPDWASAGDLHFREYDYAMLKLDTTLGTTNGTMLLSSISDDGTVKSLDARNHGYPVDTPDGSAASATNLWGMHCDITAAYSGRLAYNCDTSGGQSGSPVYYLNDNGSYYMLAIHSGPNAFDNTGARISNVRSWFVTEMSGW